MIIQADILKWAEEYDGEPFHALLCDPPYHLAEIVKRFGGAESTPAQYGRDGAFQRASRGFMGKQWDGGDVAFRPETWAALAQHLHPGAFGMAFASTKGYHRMACAIEDAGLIIHPMIVYAFGSGFPKATRVDVQVDRRAGAERKVVGQRKHQPKFDAAGHGYREKDNGYNSKDRESFDVTAPTTELAQAWEGHRYGGQVLKPALEPICVFQKPYGGRPVDCITRTGAGALWVDGGRIGTGEDRSSGGNSGGMDLVYAGGLGKGHERPEGGRWPANLLLNHLPACRAVGTRKVQGTRQGTRRGNANFRGGERHDLDRDAGYADAEGYESVTAWACAEGCPVAALDAQSGVLTSSSGKPFKRSGANNGYDGGWGVQDVPGFYGDSGGASRFFHQSHWTYEIEERIASADPVRYCAKASKAEREGGLDPLQIKLMGQMEIEEGRGRVYAQGDGFKGRTFRDGQWVNVDEFPETTVGDGRQTPIDNPYQRGETKRRNTHPTIKPLSLTRYLATLLLPPEHYAPRRILVPFSGVASEYIGAVLAGWDEVVGVEIGEEYIKIAEARVAFWRALRYRLLVPAADLSVDLGDDEDGQLSLWEAA